ncbi:16S rRNA (uracil(1498)-N(3))-methyltransferase [Neomicrococcus aestuarii]|uniref:Ribosomal RNA small subunit methyltransferase E n=1 Tax=Neomicrococcus aestuarii TaxID=556325 RepID=A0A1L2ZM38_9MICC|nr:16S rRNA (uracil(1498)-N(3))-methyltransferase [Neomicrococcus aestuarii]APF40088.1 16S rRNA (uracil(1498)-N(3))-methyltransferase [Neomicrococcus aestuarii]
MSNQAFWYGSSLAAVVAGDELELGGPEGHHASNVKRIAVGEQVDLVDGEGHRAVTEVTATSKSGLSLKALQLHTEAAPRFPVTLVQALAKGDRDLQAVESAVELDVSHVVPWQSERSIVKWPADRAAKALAKWESLILSATKQSRRSFRPSVETAITSTQLTRRIGEWTADGSLVVILHEAENNALAHVVSAYLNQRTAQGGLEDASGAVVLIVGPEGGISPQEIEKFTQAGAVPALLGRNVLRSSSAGPAAMVLVRHLTGEL